jgi:hypothetical protein
MRAWIERGLNHRAREFVTAKSKQGLEIQGRGGGLRWLRAMDSFRLVGINVNFLPDVIDLAAPLPGLALVSGAQYGVAGISVVLVVACVLLHYEVLRKISDWLDRLRQLHRMRVLVLILGLLATHIGEIWIYALGYGLLDGAAGFGNIARTVPNALPNDWLDYIYFSFVTYTTVGYGDLVPAGPIRFIAATEALNGWVLLGWSVSFTFLEMQKFWRGPKS